MSKKSTLEIAREYFPYLNDEALEHIIWEETGYPSFWNIPKDGKTPEQCFRKQLKDFADKYETMLVKKKHMLRR